MCDQHGYHCCHSQYRVIHLAWCNKLHFRSFRADTLSLSVEETVWSYGFVLLQWLLVKLESVLTSTMYIGLITDYLCCCMVTVSPSRYGLYRKKKRSFTLMNPTDLQVLTWSPTSLVLNSIKHLLYSVHSSLNVLPAISNKHTCIMDCHWMCQKGYIPSTTPNISSISYCVE